jgi:hypothetical protein
MLRAMRAHNATHLKRALLADIRDGMGLIGASGFAAAAHKARDLGAG